MTSDLSPKRRDDETGAEIVKRRLIDAVREQIDEIKRSGLKNVDAELLDPGRR